jgi:hypothetical protein
MSAALKLATPPPSDERSALRLAIQAAEAASDAVAEHDAAIKRAEDLLDARREALEAIKLEVQHAIQIDSEAVAEAIKSGSPMPVGKTREVRSAELSATDDVEGALAALRTLETQRHRLAGASGAARAAVDRAVSATLSGFVSALCDRIADARREELICSHIIDSLTSLPPGVAITDSHDSISDFMHARSFAKDAAPTLEDLAMLRPWRERFEGFRKSLASNPDAVLPDLP